DQIAYPIPGNDDAIRSVTLLTRVVADAVAAGLQQRHARSEGGEKNVSAVDAEPLAEWERELLAQSEAQQQNAPAAQSVAAEQPAPAEAPSPMPLPPSSPPPAPPTP